MKNLIMTPGPTHISKSVRDELSRQNTNPDLDFGFFEEYKSTCELVKKIGNTKNEVFIMNAEAILGLESACASLIEEGDKVLCIDNGIFGEGFGDFAKMYGGQVTYYKDRYDKSIDIEGLEECIRKNGPFKLATLVHCETPSGIVNDIEKIVKVLNRENIISVVDAVSSFAGEEIEISKWGIDVLIAGSQKCISAPSGSTIMIMSDDSLEMIKNRKTPVRGFYANLKNWIGWYEKKEFPYTQSDNQIYALKKALENIIDENGYRQRHEKIAQALRTSVKVCGLELYPSDDYSNTVTAIKVPEGIEFSRLFAKMKDDHNILIGGSLGSLKDKVFRIGNMGENAYVENMDATLEALDSVLMESGVKLSSSLRREFELNIKG